MTFVTSLCVSFVSHLFIKLIHSALIIHLISSERIYKDKTQKIYSFRKNRKLS